MSKPHKTTASASPKAPEAPHLDTAITRSVTKGVTFIQKFRIQVAFVLALLIIIFLIYQVVGLVHEARQDDLLTRLHRLVDAESARAANVESLLGEIDRLAQDSRGEASERLVLKSLVGFLLGKAYPEDPGFSASPSDPLPGGGKTKNPELVRRIEDLAREGALRYPNDADIKAWSEAVLARTKGEREFKIPDPAKPAADPAPSAAGAGTVPPAPLSGPTLPAAPAPAPAPQPTSVPPNPAGK